MAKRSRKSLNRNSKMKSSIKKDTTAPLSIHHRFTVLVASILICQIVGNLFIPVTISAIPAWYMFLHKANFNPPTWVFGPVWIILYTLMGIALYLIWEQRTKKDKLNMQLKLFGIQLTINLLWSILFFGLRSPLLGFITIMGLWIAVLATMISFWKISKNATLIMVPYLLWVSFAVILNFYIWFLN